MLKLSIVMVSLNNQQNFKKSFESIGLISELDVTVIVVDSSSNQEISNYVSINKISNHDIKYIWVEPEGIYQAMNLGLSLCKEDSLVWFLNPGDELIDVKALRTLINLIETNDCDWGFCQAVYDRSQQSAFPLDANGVNAFKILTGRIPVSHQAVLSKTNLLNTLGGFDLKYEIAADLDLLTRMIMHTEPIFLNLAMVKIDSFGTSHKKLVKLYLEIFRLARVYKFESTTQITLRILNVFFHKFMNSKKIWIKNEI
jgi:GT2 family glycosyltransferase